MTEARTVVDENGALYTLTERLGQGGQGSVWLAQGGRRVVKIFSSGRDREALRRQISYVKRLDLRDLHVARPLALLRAPQVGYVAEFLSGMVPIRKLLQPPKGCNIAEWYRETGGLRRRLRLLAHAGEALGGLHARGLIYGDISHNNIFVSEAVEANEAWLIDLDNLRHDSDPASALYTPGYGAPEVVDGSRGPTSLSDAWAFAVLCFHVLALVHPFCGDLVTEGEPELEEEAFAGRLPWIDHSSDEQNRSSSGLPRELVLANRLRELAGETFESGVRDLLKRPGIGEWVERLHLAADQTLRCPGCQGTYFVTARSCPWCGASKPPVVPVELNRWEPGRGVITAMARRTRLPLSDELFLTRRHTRGESGLRARTLELKLKRRERGVQVVAQGDPVWVTPLGHTDVASIREITTRGLTLLVDSREPSWVIHFGPVDTPHRVAVLDGGAR